MKALTWVLFGTLLGISFLGCSSDNGCDTKGSIGNAQISLPGGRGPEIIIEAGGERTAVGAPNNFIWSHLQVAPETNAVFVLRHRKTRNGSNWDAIVRVDLVATNIPHGPYSQQEVLTWENLQTMLPDAWVSELDAVSPDGSRLLLRVSSKDVMNSTESVTFFKSAPFFYSIRDKTLNRVLP